MCVNFRAWGDVMNSADGDPALPNGIFFIGVAQITSLVSATSAMNETAAKHFVPKEKTMIAMMKRARYQLLTYTSYSVNLFKLRGFGVIYGF